MNGQIFFGILVMLFGTGVGTYLIQKGRTKIAFDSNKKLIAHINSLDSASRNEVLKKSSFNKDEIVFLVNSQTKSSAVEIITEVQDKFGIINQDLEEKEKKIKELEGKEAKRIEDQKAIDELKRTIPDLDFSLENDNGRLMVVMNFNNKVPIRMRPYLAAIWDNEQNDLKGIWNLPVEYREYRPDENMKAYYEYDSLRNKKLPLGEKVLGFKMIIRYQSIYYPEIKNKYLAEKIVEVSSALDPRDNKFKHISDFSE